MWTEIHNQIRDEVEGWTVTELFNYLKDKDFTTGSLDMIIQDVVQHLYEARYSEEEQEDIEASYWEEYWKQKRVSDARAYKGSFREAMDNGVSFSQWMMQQRS